MNRKRMLDVTEESTREMIKLMHPEKRKDTHNATFHAYVACPDILKFIEGKFSSGQAPGPSGWTGELLLSLLKDNDACDLLVFFVSDLRNVLLPYELNPYILGASLLALSSWIACSAWPSS